MSKKRLKLREYLEESSDMEKDSLNSEDRRKI